MRFYFDHGDRDMVSRRGHHIKAMQTLWLDLKKLKRIFDSILKS